jgi:hypothetical protein
MSANDRRMKHRKAEEDTQNRDLHLDISPLLMEMFRNPKPARVARDSHGKLVFWNPLAKQWGLDIPEK